LIFSLFVLAIPAYFLVKAMEYSPQARIVPLVIAIPVLALQILVILGHQFPRLIRGFDVDIVGLAKGGNPVASEDSAGAGGAELGYREELRRVAVMVGWMVAIFGALLLVGFLPTLFGFVFLFLLISGRTSWWGALLAGVVFTALVWAAFAKAMRFALFEGVLFGALIPSL
jgi:hypothetical protein